MNSLTGLRFIAAFTVFVFHATFVRVWPPDVQAVMDKIVWQGGWSGVSFFFVLSGFVLAWSVRSTDTTRAFWRRRFFKIYPNHLVTFIAAAILLATVAHTAINERHAFLNMLLLQSWSPEFGVRGGFNGVAWSLSCEALFYLLFPILMRWINRIRPERLWAWAGGVVAVILALPFAATALPNEPQLATAAATDLEVWIIYQLPLPRVLDFVFGILMARIVLAGRKLPFGRRAATVLVLAAYAASELFPVNFRFVAVMVVPIGLLIAAAGKADAEGQRSWLSSRVMVWLGDVSFAFYMWHALILFYVHPWLFGPSTNIVTALAEVTLLLGISLVVAWLQFSMVERPVMRRFAVSRRDRRRNDPRAGLDLVPATTPGPGEDRSGS